MYIYIYVCSCASIYIYICMCCVCIYIYICIYQPVPPSPAQTFRDLRRHTPLTYTRVSQVFPRSFKIPVKNFLEKLESSILNPGPNQVSVGFSRGAWLHSANDMSFGFMRGFVVERSLSSPKVHANPCFMSEFGRVFSLSAFSLVCSPETIRHCEGKYGGNDTLHSTTTKAGLVLASVLVLVLS